MASTTTVRGEGRIYVGSIEEARGLAVVSMDDCECGPCAALLPWDEARRVRVLLAAPSGLLRLEHARQGSFQ